jgi:hypothetical protein
MHLGVPLFRAGDGADHLHQVVQPDDIDYSKVREVGKLAEGSEAAYRLSKPRGHSIASRRLPTDTRSGWR